MHKTLSRFLGVLLFQATCLAQSLDHFSWSAISNQFSGTPFNVSVTASDLNNQVVSSFGGPAWLAAWTTSAPPAILISEVDTANARVELSNVGNSFEDVSGIELILYDNVSWPAPRITFQFPSLTIVPPGGVFEVRAGGTNVGAYPIFFTGSPLSWGTINGPVAVRLRAPGGVPMDFVSAGTAFPPGITEPAPLVAPDWFGLQLAANGSSSLTYQRIGNIDHHNAADWVVTNRTMGSLNSKLSVPFQALPIAVATTLGSVTFTNGQWSGSVSVSTNEAWVFLRMDDRAGHSGDSAYFRISSGPELTIQAPGEAHENSAGSVGMGLVSLPFVVSTNVSVTLTSSVPLEISVPAQATILAGGTNITFSITNYDDGLLDGTRVAVITAKAAGFAPATTTMSNVDDEVATLSWVAPTTVSEGSGTVAGTAQVRVSTAPTFPFVVMLGSNNTNELRVPPYIYIPAGQTSAVVDLTVIDDLRIDGSQPVVLQATVPTWVPAQTTVFVADNEPTNLSLTVTTPMWEGSGTLTNGGSVRVSGTLSSNLPITLISDTPGKLIVPASVVIPAGQTSVVVSVTIPDDGTNDGRTFVRVVAQEPRFVSATNIVTVRDNDVNHFSISSIGSAHLSGSTIFITVQAFNRDGEVLSLFNGVANVLASDANGPVTVAPASIGPFTNGTWSGAVQVFGETTGVMLTVTDGAGHIGTSASFDVVTGTLVNIPISDIGFDSTRGKLWAGVKTGAVVGARSIVEIDPATGALGTNIFLGSDPGRIEISDDGRFLYAALMGTGGVARIGLSSNAVDLRFPIGPPTTTAVQLGVLPGDAHGLIVQMSGANAGTALFRNGVQRPEVVSPAGFPTEYSFNFYSSPSNFIYFNGSGMLWLNARSNGIAIVRGAPNPPYVGFSVYAREMLFFRSGDVVEPRDLRRLGAYSTNGLVAVDANAGEVFFLSGNRLRIFDLPSFVEIGSTRLPTNGNKLLRCGSNSLAIATTDGKLLLVQSKHVRRSAAADLSVTQSASSSNAIIQSNLTYSITVSNGGPGVATNVVFIDVLPVDSALVSSASSQGTRLFTNGIFSCSIGSLGVGASATVEFTVQPMTPGPLRNACWVTGDGINPTNSTSILETKAVFGPVLPAVTRLRINSTLLTYDSTRNVLWTANERFDNAPIYSLRSITLTSGLPQTVFPLTYPSAVIALSADQNFLYRAYGNLQDGYNYIARANLTANVFDQTFRVLDGFNQPHGVVDMIGISSFPSDIVAARSGPQNDIALYQNGVVIRRSPSDTWPGRLEVNPTIPTRLYRLLSPYVGGNVLRLDIGASSINQLTSAGFSGSDLRFANGQLFSDVGLVMNAEGLVNTGAMPVAGSVQPDPALGLVFYLVASGTNQILTAFDIATFQPAWSYVLPAVSGAAGNLVKCGPGLLAFRTSEDELFILNVSLLPHGLNTDLSVAQLPNGGETITNVPVTFTANAWNYGPSPATGVYVTNVLPANAIITGISCSQGSVTNVGNIVIGNLGNLPIGSYGWLQVVATLTNAGILTNVATVAGIAPDLILSNNIASSAVSFITIPTADTSVRQTITAGLPGVVGSNLTYSITVSNNGPAVAVNTYLVDTFESGSQVISAQVSQGNVSWDTGQVIALFGNLTNGASATLTLVLRPSNAGIAFNTVLVGSDVTDMLSANNQSVYPVQIVSQSGADLVKEFRLRVSDIIFDPLTEQIRATMRADSGIFSNSVVKLDPLSGELTHPILIGDLLGGLAISDDAQYLYAARVSTGGVTRISLPINAVDLSFSLFPPNPPNYCLVGDMQVIPGQPRSLGVSVRHGQSNLGLFIYDDGVPRPDIGGASYFGGVHPIAFDGTSNVVYQTYPFALRKFAIDANGAQFVSDTGGLVPAEQVAFEFDGGQIYFQSGRVIDPVAGTIVGQFPVSGLVVPDSASGLIYFATTAGYAAWNYQISVRAFNITNFTELWSVPLPIASGSAMRLIKLSAGGFAVATDAGRVFVVQTPGPAANVSLQKTFSQSLVSTGVTFNATLTVQNLGLLTAHGLSVTDALPAGLSFVSATVPGGSYTVSNNVVVCSFAPLNNGATVAATLQLMANSPGTFTNVSMVSAVETDDVSSNNISSAVVTAIPLPAIQAPDFVLREGDVTGSIFLPVNLTSLNANTVTVQYQTLNGTAIAGQDYNASSGNVIFNPGVSNRTIFLSGGIRGNTLVESNRYFFLRLTNAVNATLPQTLIKVTMLDDDYYAFAVTGVSVPEGNSSFSSALFTVRLLKPANLPVSVDYRTLGGSAVSGQDFQSRSGTLVFAPGVTNLSVPVSILGDSIYEPDENFAFDLANPFSGVVTINTVQGTILNDDAIPPLLITLVIWEPGAIRLRFSTLAGSVYRVERSRSLQSPDWTIVYDQIMGTGSEVEISDSGPSSLDHGFYRVRRLQ